MTLKPNHQFWAHNILAISNHNGCTTRLGTICSRKCRIDKGNPSNVTKTDDLNNENIPTAKENELPLNLEIRRNVYATGEKKTNYKTNNIVHYSCSICGKDTTEVRYHNLKIKSYMYNPTSTINNASVLCEICYDQGLFPLSFHSSDFIQLKNRRRREMERTGNLVIIRRY